MFQMIFLLVLPFIITLLTQGMVRTMLIEAGQVSVNFRGQKIPGAMGIAVILSVVITASVAAFLDLVELSSTLYIVFACSLMGFAGIIDDFLGNHQSKGFKGHMLNLMKGNLTTGGLKAVIGGAVSLAIGLQFSTSFWELILNTLIIALTANLINLLDTRPGRAIKGFVILTLVALSVGRLPPVHLIVLGALAAYFPVDLKAQGMLGDTGANFIGIILGTSLAVSADSMITKLIWLILFLGLNVLSERYSFSKIIENSRLLRYFDVLGRERE